MCTRCACGAHAVRMHVRMQCNPYTQCSQHLRDHAKTGGHEESDREDDHGGHLRLVGRRLWLAQSKQRRACARVCARPKVCPRLQLARRGQLSSLSRNRGAARWYRADPRCRDQTRGREHGDRPSDANTVSLSDVSLFSHGGGTMRGRRTRKSGLKSGVADRDAHREAEAEAEAEADQSSPRRPVRSSSVLAGGRRC